MREIRQIVETELDEFVRITAEAYPGMKINSPEEREKLKKRLATIDQDPTLDFYGLFEGGELWGLMRLHHFTMKLLSVKTLVGGVGGVAVDLRHKKKKVARDMIRYFLHYYRQRGACMTILYPFRPDFYKKMGFGWGTKMNQYRFKPEGLMVIERPLPPPLFLSADDKWLIRDCYNRYLDKTNGLTEKPHYVWEGLFNDPAVKVIGVKEEGQVQSYMITAFEAGNNLLHNHLEIREVVYETAESLHTLLAYLRAQADQVDRITLRTQDESFHYLLNDPRNQTGNIIPSVYHESNVQGIGIMYRVIDVPRLFEVLGNHSFGGQTCHLKITLVDSFLPENSGSTIIHFREGRATVQPINAPFQVEIKLDVADFSSLVLGAVNFERLVVYGLAQISDEKWVEVVNKVFAAERPLCMTGF